MKGISLETIKSKSQRWHSVVYKCKAYICFLAGKIEGYSKFQNFRQSIEKTNSLSIYIIYKLVYRKCCLQFVGKAETEGVFIWDPKWNLPETKFQSTVKEILFTLLFIVGEMKRISFRARPEINSPLSKSQSFLFTHVQMFPFIWFHFR